LLQVHITTESWEIHHGEFHEGTKSKNSGILFSKEQRAYRRHFSARNGPSVTMIRKPMQRFEETGYLMKLPHTGRPRSARKEENINRVRASIEEEPQISTRRRSRELGLS
jgi:hypothetical protein